MAEMATTTITMDEKEMKKIVNLTYKIRFRKTENRYSILTHTRARGNITRARAYNSIQYI